MECYSLLSAPVIPGSCATATIEEIIEPSVPIVAAAAPNVANLCAGGRGACVC